MGTTAEKLTYLNTTKTKIRTGLNNLGAELTENDTFRSYANVLADIYDELPKVTGSGTDLELSNTKKGKLAITPKGNSSQFSTTGKNLFNGWEEGQINTTTGEPYDYSGRYRSKDYIEIQQATDYYFSNARLVSSAAYWFIIFKYDENKNYLGRQNLVEGDGYAYRGLINISDNETKYIKFTEIVPLTSFTNTQLELGTSKTDYEPYTGGIPAPNPSYPFMPSRVTGENSVEICNVNLFDGIVYKANYSVGSDGTLSSNTNYNLYKYNINQNSNFTIKLKNTDTNSRTSRAVAFDKNDNFIETLNTITISSGTTSSYSFTTPNNTSYILFHLPKLNSEVMFVKGSTAPSEYIEHEEQNYQLTLKSNNIIGLDTRQYHVDLKVGDKITITNNSANTLNLNLYTNYGDITRNDNWSVQAGVTRVVTVGYDSKAIAWSSAPSGGLAWVNLGTTSLSYKPYTENPIELCKIGDYQDYIYKSGDNWYKKEMISKIQYLVTGGSVGSGGGDFATMKTRGYLCRYFNITNLRGGSDRSLIMSNRFKGTNATLWNGDAHSDGIQTASSDTSSTVYIGIKFSTIEDYYGSELTTSNIQSAWRKYFTDHLTYIYFRVLEPQDIPITDTTLISQLNDIYENAKSYNGTTNITTTYEDGNEQMVLDASALKSWEVTE